jgi:hypothetical protein
MREKIIFSKTKPFFPPLRAASARKALPDPEKDARLEDY